MSLPLTATYLLFAATLMRSLLVRARLLPPTCASCGLPLERQQLGDPICSCRDDG